MLIGTIQDITGHKLAEIALARQVERLNALRTIDQAIITNLDLRFTLGILLEQITHQLKIDAGDILLLSEGAQMLHFAASRGFYTDALKHTALPLGKGFAGQVVLERKQLRLSNLHHNNGYFSQSPLLGEEGFESYIGLPLLAKERVLGVMELFQRGIIEQSVDWADLLEIMTDLTAISIDNAVLFDNMRQSKAEIEMAYEATLEGWSRALDLRDNVTEGHSQRVADLTIRLAKSLGLSEAETTHLHRGALLHDIGKMAIPDVILRKPGPLDAKA